jgi:ubiquinone/menaquinone biosynthesis C-methylase UbiE
MLKKEFKKETSWTQVGKWYNGIVGEKGHFYHQEVIIPHVLRLLNLNRTSRLLDLGCGQGILARAIPSEVNYLGIDLAANLVDEARKLDQNRNHSYAVADVTKDLPIKFSGFSQIAIILALQNIKHPFKVIKNCATHLNKGGKLVIVLNHPSFRIPKHSDWLVDKNTMTQYRKNDIYMSPLEIPIDSSPFDKNDNVKTWSFHYPLSAYSEMLFDNGFVIEKIEEWVSPKKSEGGMAEVEDKARKEFPLFMAIVASKR